MRIIKFIWILVLLAFPLLGNATEPFTNIRGGLHYYVERSYLFHTSSFYEYEIGEKISINGKEAHQIFGINPDTNERYETPVFLHIEGTKVYQLGTYWPEYENTWFLIYDFGLQVGETMEGYLLNGPQPEKYIYRCLQVENDPIYNRLKTLSLQVAYSDMPDTWTSDVNPSEKWIVGIGSIHGLLNPHHSFCVCDSNTILLEVTDGDDKLFSLLDKNEVIEISDSSIASSMVFDIKGQRVNADIEHLPTGLYIVMENSKPRKIMVK
ncbi:MAG: hypothetical protein HDR80_10555 [Bacteroides sp.]|nr:hypothetical protein [Bacteroides sp.]